MERRLNMLLIGATALALIAALFLAVWSGFSDGRSAADVHGSYIYLVLAGIVALCSLPSRVGAAHSPGLALAIGMVIVVASFVSTVAVFFLPAAACLLLVSWLAPGQDG